MIRPKLLIADDDQQFLKGFSQQFRQAGYEVIPAGDGKAAVELATQTPPDLLILDVHMPSGDGITIVQEMDDNPALRSIPVIFVTGDKDEITADLAETHGAISVIHKPVDVEELLDAIGLLVETPESGLLWNDSLQRDVA